MHIDRIKSFLLVRLLIIAGLCCSLAVGEGPHASPSDTVREFYKAMREKRFREAFATSIYKPAIQGLKQEDVDDLRPEFEKVTAALSGKIEVTGDQISCAEPMVLVTVP